MEILNIGPLELLVILVIAVLMFGPDDLVNFAHKAGRWIYNLRRSELWQEIVGTTKEIQDFPQKIMKEAELEETMKEINALNQTLLNSEPFPKVIDAANPDPPLAQTDGEHAENEKKTVQQHIYDKDS
jgi:Sec-independent protein translocase protein TatA